MHLVNLETLCADSHPPKPLMSHIPWGMLKSIFVPLLAPHARVASKEGRGICRLRQQREPPALWSVQGSPAVKPPVGLLGCLVGRMDGRRGAERGGNGESDASSALTSLPGPIQSLPCKEFLLHSRPKEEHMQLDDIRVMRAHLLHQAQVSYFISKKWHKMIQPSVQMQKSRNGMSGPDAFSFACLRPSIFAHVGSSGRNLR